jgi:hypothetical protein
MYMGHWPPVQTRPFSTAAAQTPADDLQTRAESGFSQNTAVIATANHPFNFSGNSSTQDSDANNNNNAIQGNNVQNELWEWSSGAVGSAPSCSDEPAPTADDASSADLDHVTGCTNETAGDTSGGSNEDPEMLRPSVCNWLNGLDPCVQLG